MIDKKQPIVIKKIIQGGHAHHGGAWKVAFADFVTAMMAFFLLMWLLSSTSEEQKGAISEYFNNPSLVAGASLTPAASSVHGPGGASTSLIQLGGALDIPREKEQDSVNISQEQQAEQAQQAAEEKEDKQRLDELMERLKAAIEKSQALKPFKDQLLLDITPEGLRIQIVDKENRPMFDSGAADLKWYTVEILRELASSINEVPNRVSLSGHTDAEPFKSRDDYSNWELSADRANAARRALLFGGMEEHKIGRVVGLSSSVLFNKEDAYDPINRRISIIVMNKKTEAAIARSEGVEDRVVRQLRSFDDHQNTFPLELLEDNDAPSSAMELLD